MKKVQFFLWVSALSLLIVVQSSISYGAGTGKLPKRVTMGTLSMGTLYYAISSGWAKVASDNCPIAVVVMPTSGAQAYMSQVGQTGRPEIGASDLHTSWQTFTGSIAPPPVPKEFPKKIPYPKSPLLRNLMCGPVYFVGMAVRNDLGITKVEQLRGKRVAWGWSAFSPGISLTLACLANAGLTLDDVKPVPVAEVVSAVRAVADGRIDATMCAVGMGAISEADAMVGVRFLNGSATPEGVKAGRRIRPTSVWIPVGPGPAGLKEKAILLGSTMNVFGSTHLADEVAYTLVKAWYENYQQWQGIHPLLKFHTQKSFVNKNTPMPIPYHNGAIKFYKEVGVWDADMDQVQKRVLKGR
jgi:TRAP transporter TAXI family solute receptor